MTLLHLHSALAAHRTDAADLSREQVTSALDVLLPDWRTLIEKYVEGDVGELEEDYLFGGAEMVVEDELRRLEQEQE